MSEKVAVLLAGGKGTRLQPYTTSIPKPLVTVGQYPIAEIVVRQLKKNGFTSVFFAVNHLAHLITDYFGNGERFGMKFRYYQEMEPLGTMGPLRAMQDELPSNFLVMNGDVLTDISFSAFLSAHEQGGCLFTIASKERTHTIDYGILEADENNVLSGFHEKPTIPYLVSMGVYAVSKKVLCDIPENTYFGFDNLMLSLLAQNKKVNVHRYDGYWNDIGRPDDYIRAIEDYETLKGTFSS